MEQISEEEVRRQITLGAMACARLKNIYFENEHWVSCCRKVAAKFSELKVKARAFYVDKNETEMLMELSKYNDQDIIDAMNSST